MHWILGWYVVTLHVWKLQIFFILCILGQLRTRRNCCSNHCGAQYIHLLQGTFHTSKSDGSCNLQSIFNLHNQRLALMPSSDVRKSLFGVHFARKERYDSVFCFSTIFRFKLQSTKLHIQSFSCMHSLNVCKALPARCDIYKKSCELMILYCSANNFEGNYITSTSYLSSSFHHSWFSLSQYFAFRTPLCTYPPTRAPSLHSSWNRGTFRVLKWPCFDLIHAHTTHY